VILQISLGEIEEGRPVIKVVGKTAVGLLRVGGRVYAFDPFCPHSRWNLGASGRLVRNDGRLYIFCKGHGGLWCLDTGVGMVQGKKAASSEALQDMDIRRHRIRRLRRQRVL
jgi:anthranilate 1,2-dioxygenase ferredoxin subunit